MSNDKNPTIMSGLNTKNQVKFLDPIDYFIGSKNSARVYMGHEHLVQTHKPIAVMK